jgi:hypothetical protein
MAAIVNARDVKLQATSPRLLTVTLPDNVVVPAVKSVRLTAPSLVFKLDAAGTATPSSITVTATLVQVTGTVSWSITGGTLTGSGTSRTLAQADMTADTAIITASVTESGVTYSNTITIVRVRDGAGGSNGTNGTNGQRGTVQLARAISGSTWSNTEAAAAITANGSGSPIAGDVVTLYNLTTNYSEARVYTAGAWSALSAYFPGSLLVDKSVIAGKVNGYGLQVLAGDYAGWSLPVGSSKKGFYLGSEGLMLGNDTSYVRIDSTGAISMPGFSVVGGSASYSGALSAATGTFAGALSAATGTFAGSFTASAVSAVNTVNIAGEAVTVPRAAYTAGAVALSSSMTDVQSVSITTHGQKVLVNFGCIGLAYSGNVNTTGYYGAPIQLALYRDGTQLMTWTHEAPVPSATTAPSSGGAINMPPFIDQPAAGTYTYAVKASTTATTGNSVSCRGLSALECQR